VAYTNFGEYDKALQSFDQVIQLEPDNAAGYDNKGALFFRQGKFNECIPAFQKALQLQPYAATYSNLGTAYFFLKRYPEAVQQFEKAVEMNPDEEMMVGNGRLVLLVRNVGSTAVRLPRRYGGPEKRPLCLDVPRGTSRP